MKEIRGDLAGGTINKDNKKDLNGVIFLLFVKLPLSPVLFEI